MRLIDAITDDASQIHLITLDDNEVTLELRFLSVVQIWVMNVTYKDKTIKGVKLSLGALHMVSKNFPFDFILEDTSTFGIDPYKQDDFSGERCRFYIVDPNEMAEIRGVAVEL